MKQLKTGIYPIVVLGFLSAFAIVLATSSPSTSTTTQAAGRQSLNSGEQVSLYCNSKKILFRKLTDHRGFVKCIAPKPSFSIPPNDNYDITLSGGDKVNYNCGDEDLIHNYYNTHAVSISCTGGGNDHDPTATPTPEDILDVFPTEPDAPLTDTPISSLPACTDHDPNEWHALIHEDGSCHYNHEHKDNPHQVDHIFGTEYYTTWGNGELSYPWQTFAGANSGYPAPPTTPGRMENDLKHEGYGWLVRENMDCQAAKTPGCITDARVQYHAIFAAPGAITRFHSYWYEARACLKNRPDDCGIVRSGGWIDYGYLIAENNNGEDVVVQLPDMPGNIRPPIGPKRGHSLVHAGPDTTHKASSNWYGFNRNSTMFSKIALSSKDVWQNIHVDDPTVIDLYCPDFHCQYNGSTMELHQFSFFGQHKLDEDGDGYINFNGYTDRYGHINDDCTSVGLDCVPLIIENLPLDSNEKYFTRFEHVDAKNGLSGGLKDYDTSPSGEYWITYPN